MKSSAAPAIFRRAVSLSRRRLDSYMSRLRSFLPDDCSPGLPTEELSPDQNAIKYLLQECFSKYAEKGDSVRTFEKAMMRFKEAEGMCQETNESFWTSRIRSNPTWPVIQLAQEHLWRLIGSVPDLNEVAKYFDFGPGATTRLRRRQADAAYKFSGKPETTAGNLVLAHAAICHVALWKHNLGLSEQSLEGLTVVEGNKVITVPKNSETDRCIAVEPDMNIYVQKGIGRVLRRLLLRWKVDLDDQTPNQILSELGSRDGSLATIDMSMASDTVARSVVEFFLPPAWVSLLEQARSPIGVLPSGEKVRYQKFSSMGNGYTFELESAIFAALVRACYQTLGIGGRPWAVYGDDVVIDSTAVPLLSAVLSACGFKVNAKKSHVEGHFRESCGKHFFQGRDVTPFYIRRPVKGLAEVLLLHNNMWRWRDRCITTQPVWDCVESILTELKAMAPAWLRDAPFQDGYGDGFFVAYCDEVVFQRARGGWEYYVVSAWLPGSRVIKTEDEGLLLKSLRSFEVGRRDQYQVYPTMKTGFRRFRLLIEQFPSSSEDFGGISASGRGG